MVFLILAVTSFGFANCEIYFIENERFGFYDYEDALNDSYYGDRLPNDARFLESQQESVGHYYDGASPDPIDASLNTYGTISSFSETGSNIDF
jgi:hypothetical protein